MFMLVGLGNPGDQYKNNRHNAGFMVIDAIASRFNFPAFRSKFQGQMSEGTIDGQKIVLLKPQTYMNLSGQSVVAAAKFFKLTPDKIYVFHDELDIESGKVRVKIGGGNAGHNGLKSIQAHLNTADFWRVRLGIAHPGDKGRVHNHVLGDFSKEEQKWLETLLDACSNHVALLVKNDPDGYMSKVAAEIKG